jgi:hypothetical protein
VRCQMDQMRGESMRGHPQIALRLPDLTLSLAIGICFGLCACIHTELKQCVHVVIDALNVSMTDVPSPLGLVLFGG